MPWRSGCGVAALCADQQRILLTFDKDFGEIVFRRGLPTGSGVALFRFTPDTPKDAATMALALVEFSTGSSRVILRGYSRPDSGSAACRPPSLTDASHSWAAGPTLAFGYQKRYGRA